MKIKSLFVLILASVFLNSIEIAVAEISIGSTRSEVIDLFGAPSGQLKSDEEEVLTYFQGIISLKNGKVIYIDSNFLSEEQPLPKQKYKVKPEIAADNSDFRRVEELNYILFIPSTIQENKKYPLIIALSPNADYSGMIKHWQSLASKYSCLVMASKTHRNGVNYDSLLPGLRQDIRSAIKKYPVDNSRIIATGFSGGAMTSHALSYEYSKMITAVMLNTGIIHEYYKKKNEKYPKNKVAVFIASLTDFRYDQMKDDMFFLKKKGWQVKWLEFKGGHTIATENIYDQGLEWHFEQLRYEY